MHSTPTRNAHHAEFPDGVHARVHERVNAEVAEPTQLVRREVAVHCAERIPVLLSQEGVVAALAAYAETYQRFSELKRNLKTRTCLQRSSERFLQ